MILIDDEGRRRIDSTGLMEEQISALSLERVKILRFAAKKPVYAAEIAREMGVTIQRVYYHIRRLETAKLLVFVDYLEVNGAVAKRYKTSMNAASVVFGEEWKTHEPEQNRAVPNYLRPFIKNEFFDGLMVLGSPDPHGKYRARASDLGMLELSMFLGRYATFDFPLYRLDTQIKESELQKSLILAGGPKVNTIVAQINDKLPVRFGVENAEIKSELSGRTYSENVGLIELVKNPNNPDSWILVIGGVNQQGTRAAVMAIVKKSRELDLGNSYDPGVIAKVVEGFDEDGDGIVDEVEIKE
ncbi:S-layer protein [Candidatus Micrarchaeota archaeon]|nr:S-layer protein [Candidatus Micrarchaeota archaeon]